MCIQTHACTGRNVGTRWRCAAVRSRTCFLMTNFHFALFFCQRQNICTEYRVVCLIHLAAVPFHPLQLSHIFTRMCCARIINGIGTGFLNVIVPVWSAEVASHTTRGAMIAFEFTLNILGVVVAYWLEFGLSFIGNGDTQVRWRVSCSCSLLVRNRG